MARVAVVVDEMFEESELLVPCDLLKQAGHEVVIVGRETGKWIEGMHGRESITTARGVREVTAHDFDALVVPGGYSPDHLRVDPLVVDLVREMFEAGKPVAAICHAGSLLVEAGVVEDRTVTSWPSIRTDLVNAGAHWIDQDVVEDGPLITSRRPDDLPAFCEAVLRQLEGRIPERISLLPAEGEAAGLPEPPIH
jgi:protease I